MNIQQSKSPFTAADAFTRCHISSCSREFSDSWISFWNICLPLGILGLSVNAI